MRRLIVIAFSLALAAAVLPGVAAQKDGRPRLVVLISIDQMPMETLLRFRSDFRGGFRRLFDQGKVFTQAYQNHAFTETAPGHSTMLSGLFPSHSSIIANQWYDRRHAKTMYCVEDLTSPILGYDYPGRSPHNFDATTLGDWLKTASPKSQVYSVAGKDRSAILMGGQNADGAYWYDAQTGNFITSAHYVRRVPDWAARFNREKFPNQRFGRAWDRLIPDTAFYDRFGPDLAAGEGDELTATFPHLFPSLALRPNAAYYAAFASTPFLDEYIARFSRRLIAETDLGADEATDVLAIGFSALDFLGHTYGAYSHEVSDALMRLDLVLKELFDELDSRVGAGRVAVVLTADHGALPLPETLQGRGTPARRYERPDVLRFQNLNTRLSEKLGARADWITQVSGASFYLNYDPIARHNLKRSDVEEALAALLREFDIVSAVYTRTQLQQTATGDDPFLPLYRNSFHEENSGDVIVRYKEHSIPVVSRLGTTHGTPYRYDSNIPIIFMAQGFRAGDSADRVHTVDIGPTMAEWLGVPAPKNLDGISRLKILR